MPDTPPDPPAGDANEAEHDEDPRKAQESDQKPETQPAPGDADGGDD